MSSPTVARLPTSEPFTNKTYAADRPRKENSLVLKAVKELIETGQVAFEYRDSDTIYEGKIIQPKQVKKIAQDLRYTVIASQTLVLIHDHIPSGTLFLLFSLRNYGQ